jgi:hypothetical protein
MRRAAAAPTEVCHAPKILSGARCGRRVATPGTRMCTRHLGTDPERRCQGEARARSGPRVPCYAWPLVGVPYCAAHDPEELKRRRQARATDRTAMARGRELLTTLPPKILRGTLEILLLSGQVSVATFETAVWRSRWLMAGNRRAPLSSEALPEEGRRRASTRAIRPHE